MAIVKRVDKIFLEMTAEEGLMLADYLNYSKEIDDENIITNETIKFVTSLIPKILDVFDIDGNDEI